MTTQKKAARRPDDKPFDFNLDAVQSEVELTPFVFQYSGRRWEFAHLQALDIMPLMTAAQLGDAAAMVGAFRQALGEDEWAEFQKVGLPQYKVEKLFEAYHAHCGMKPGESAASSDS
ncbi:hypothetical protein [Streptomyces sp. A1136]|uniref:hypothetical protein n=1 Tax=Streptomyces sp. A1136 TaxID=2563102 RepID=UPI00109ECA76|nr:hypothetical protein [Streptomyces sp. A1136]THA56099.1 hypothetical protein E6R62_12180 [Streptomyces sp. A1136]